MVLSLNSAFQRAANFDEVNSHCAAAVRRLSADGVTIDDGLSVAFTPSTAHLYTKSPFHHDASLADVVANQNASDILDNAGRGLQSRIMRVLSAVWASWLHARCDDGQRREMLSAGGIGSGQFWSAIPKSNKDVFENAWFRAAFLQRLHLLDFPTSAVCQVRRAATKEELCLEPLCQEHLYNCRAGPSRFRPHRALISELAALLRRAGAHVDVERYGTDLAKIAEDGSIHEAWMDVCTQVPGNCTLWRLDVTVRSTFAKYNKAALVPGVAAAAGVQTKLSRHGGTVCAISMEPLGRMPIDSTNTLWALAKEVAYRGRHGSAFMLYRRWRVAL